MKNLLTRIGGALVLVILIVGFMSRNTIVAAFTKPIDINAEYPEDYTKVKAVDTEFDMIVDIFAEEEITEETDSGAVLSRKYVYYYIVPLFTEDDVFYAGIKVDKEDSKPYDAVADSTWAYLNYETDELDKKVAFTGSFQKMDDELFGYFEEWFEEAEFFESEAEMDAHLLHLVLEPMVFENTKTAYIVMFVVLIAGIVMLVFGLMPAKQKYAPASRPIITVANVNYPSGNFTTVNQMVRKGETANAIKELQRITGASMEEAAEVISSWTAHWGN